MDLEDTRSRSPARGSGGLDATMADAWVRMTLIVARTQQLRRSVESGGTVAGDTGVEALLGIESHLWAMESALRASESRFRAILEEATDYAILTTDAEGRIDGWYPGAEAVFGWAPEEALGQSVAILFTPEDRASGAWLNELGRARETGHAPDVRWHVCKDGTRVFIDGSAYGLREPDGAFTGLLKIGQDITSQRAYDIALRESEMRQAYLLALSDALRPLIDPAAIQNEAMRVLGEHLGVLRAQFFEVAPDDEHLVSAGGYTDGVPAVVEPVRMDDLGPYVKEAFLAGRVLAVADVATDDRVSEAELAAYDALSFRSFIGVPLVKGGRFVGGLGIHHATPRAWTAAEVALAEETAERTWAAVERARAEAALGASEERYSKLLNSMDQGFCVIEKVDTAPGEPSDYRYLAANPAFERHTGMHDVVGSTIRELLGDAEERIMGLYDAVVRTGRSIQFEDYVAQLDLWMEAEVLPTETPGQIAVLFSNVSERKRAEAALRASEERLRRMVDIEGVGVILFAGDGTLLNANDAFLTMTGYTREDVRSGRLSWRAMTPPEYIEESEAQLRAGAASWRIGPYEKEYFRADGSRFWMLFAGSRLDDHTIVEYCIDISDRKRAERTLAESERRLASVLDVLPLGIGVSDISGRFILGNPEMRRYLPSGIIPSQDGDRYTRWQAWYPDGRPVERDEFPGARALRGERVVPGIEMLHRQDDGTDLWTRVAAIPIRDQAGSVTGQVVVVTDIDATKRGEEALRDSEVRYRTLVQNLPDYAIFMVDPSSVITEWTEGAERVKGYTAEEVIGQSLALFYTAEDVAAGVPERELTVAAEQGRMENEGWRVRKGGERFWVNEIATAVRDDKGRLMGFTKISRDLTERMQAEEALRAGEERYRTLFESIDQGFCTVEVLFADDGRAVDYVFREINPAFTRNTGLVDVAGKRMRELAPDHEEAWFETYGRVALTGEPERFEAEAAALGRWYNVYAYRVGEPAQHRVAILFENITERREAQAALLASEAQFRTVANLVPDLLWQSGPDGSTRWYNDRWYEYTGQTPPEAAGWGWVDAIHPDDRARSATNYRRAVEMGEPFQQEHRIRAADGSYRWFLARAEPLRDAAGPIVRWLGAATDVHDARVVRDELATRIDAATVELRTLSRRLLSVQEAERRFLARELHDEIGQVLTGLGLQLGGGGAVPATRLAEARRVVRELTEQVRQLSMDLRPAALDRYGLLPALAWHMERYQSRTGMQVDFAHEGLGRRFGAEVEIAAYRVVQEALTNVARHAGTARATVRLLAADGQLIVVVRDGGRGFDPARTTMASGLGGMRERVTLLGGTLAIESAPGAGTALTAELPLAEDTDAPEEET